MIPSAELPRLRSLCGASTTLWAGESGVRVEPGRYIALSGAPSVDFNMAVCHGSDRDDIRRSLEEIAAAGAPALIVVAGQALGDVQQLVDAGWVCIGQTAFMGVELESWRDVAMDPCVRQLELADLEDARAITEEVLGIGPELAALAFPDSAINPPAQSVWGAFEGDELICPLNYVRVDDVVTLWGIATRPVHRRKGHARQVMTSVLGYAARSGARVALGHTTPYGEVFTLSVGFEMLERWQQWSRPRWVLGRS